MYNNSDIGVICSHNTFSQWPLYFIEYVVCVCVCVCKNYCTYIFSRLTFSPTCINTFTQAGTATFETLCSYVCQSSVQSSMQSSMDSSMESTLRSILQELTSLKNVEVCSNQIASAVYQHPALHSAK